MTDLPTDEDLDLGLKAFERLESRIDQQREDLDRIDVAIRDLLSASRIAQEALRAVQEERRANTWTIASMAFVSSILGGMVVSFFNIISL